jgi:hypothetical protein
LAAAAALGTVRPAPAQVALDTAELQLLIPGCFQREPGVFLCDSIYEYEHCRTLMISRMVFSCRAGVAFENGFAEPREAAAGEYTLTLESDAEVRVVKGRRGYGRIKGEAEAEIAFDPPRETGSWCATRESYLYYPTGPKGGMSEIGEAAPCDEAIAFGFEPHRDDILRAYDLCESFAAWGGELESSIDVLAAGLFEISSASPEFRARHGAGSALIAPYLMVEAPLTIECREQ